MDPVRSGRGCSPSWFGRVRPLIKSIVNLSYAQQTVLSNGKNVASDRVWRHYCGNTDKILPFQIEKMDLMMKLAPGFDESGPSTPPVNPSLYQCRLYLKFYYENFTLP